VELSLPRVEGSKPDAVPQPDPDPTEGGRETILLVEDEVLVRDLAQQILESQGYQVLVAANGESAFERVRKQALPIDLLIADVVMPRMSGIELAIRLRSMIPDLRVLLISGYSEATTDPDAVPGAVFLAKPFTPDRLLTQVRRALAAPGPG
jgi:CheY-like chemotaxis protein